MRYTKRCHFATSSRFGFELSWSLESLRIFMPTTDLFSRGLALLAFVMAFYALAARERKTPYLVHSIYAIVWFVFASMILSLFAPVATRYRPGLGQSLEALASLVLGVGVFYVIVGVWKAYNRHANFRDDNLLKNLRLVRWAKSRWRDFFPGPTYEHDPIKFPP